MQSKHHNSALNSYTATKQLWRLLNLRLKLKASWLDLEKTHGFCLLKPDLTSVQSVRTTATSRNSERTVSFQYSSVFPEVHLQGPAHTNLVIKSATERKKAPLDTL